MRSIAVINQKGGCGKTTTAINLSALLARAGLRTLLVDVDPQGHCAAGLGVPEARIDLDVGDAMLASRPVDVARLLWRVGKNLELAPSRMRLAALEAAGAGLSGAPDRELRLRSALLRLGERHDVAVIDCPPSVGLLTFNALAAASAVLIPVETSYFALKGAVRQVNTVRTMARRLGWSVPVWILPTLHEPSSPVARDILEELRRRFGQRLLPIIVRRDPALREAASFGKPVADFDAQSTGAADYGALASWVREALTRAEPLRVLAARPAPGAADEAVAEGAEAAGADAGSEAGGGGGEDEHDLEHDFREVVHGGTRAGARPLTEPEAHGDEDEREDPDGPALFANTTGDAPRHATDETPAVAIETAPATTAEIAPVAVVAPRAEAAGATRAQDVARLAQMLRRSPDTPAGLGSRRPKVDLVPMSTPAGGPMDAPAPRSGVRVTPAGVVFTQPVGLGSIVCVAGEFNGWSPSALALRKLRDPARLEAVLQLPPGRYRYRLVIDGRWATDPHNPESEPNEFGEQNSVLRVP